MYGSDFGWVACGGTCWPEYAYTSSIAQRL